MTGEWSDKPISIYGRNSASGTYAYFKEIALFHGDYKDTVKEQPGSSAVVQGVANDKYAIGYSGVGYKTPDVRVVPLAPKKGPNVMKRTLKTLMMEIIHWQDSYTSILTSKPNEPLNPLMAQFLKYVFSKEGQMIVIKDGFYPVSKALADEDLGKVGLK